MKRRKYAGLALLTVIGAAVLAACGKPEDNAAVGPTPGMETVQPAQETEPPLKTVEDYRAAIGRMGDSEEELAITAEYYEELLARDAFEEADYTALAAVYDKLGDPKNRYRMLSKVYRLYPSAEYAELLNGIVFELQAGDSELDALMAQVKDCLESEDAGGLQALLASEVWQANMCGELAGVNRITSYDDGSDEWMIAEKAQETDITCEKADQALLFFRGNASGGIIVSGVRADNVWEGDFTVSCFDGEGAVYKRYQGTFAGNICVGDIRITVDGTDYIGKFNDDGTVAVAQQSHIQNQGGVVYAYDASGERFLYEENASVESFRLDAAGLGLAD